MRIGASLAVLVLLLVLPMGRLLPLFHLPSTVMHELAHWAVALVMGSRPSFPSIWPRRMGNTWVLGGVSFTPGTFSAGFVALAPPLVLGSAYLWLLTGVPPAQAAWLEAGWGVLCGLVLLGALPSSKDVLIAIKYPLGTVLAGFCTYQAFLRLLMP